MKKLQALIGVAVALGLAAIAALPATADRGTCARPKRHTSRIDTCEARRQASRRAHTCNAFTPTS